MKQFGGRSCIAISCNATTVSRCRAYVALDLSRGIRESLACPLGTRAAYFWNSFRCRLSPPLHPDRRAAPAALPANFQGPGPDLLGRRKRRDVFSTGRWREGPRERRGTHPAERLPVYG